VSSGSSIIPPDCPTIPLKSTASCDLAVEIAALSTIILETCKAYKGACDVGFKTLDKY